MANNNLPPMTCQDCLHLDLSVHQTSREYAVGFCRKFCETQFKITTACNQFVHTDLPSWDEVEKINKEQFQMHQAITQTYLEL